MPKPPLLVVRSVRKYRKSTLFQGGRRLGHGSRVAFVWRHEMHRSKYFRVENKIIVIFTKINETPYALLTGQIRFPSLIENCS